MSPVDWISYLALALMLGVAGQLARVAMGLKKLHDKNVSDGGKTSFDPKKFWISIALGGLAGMLAGLVAWDESTRLLQRETLLSLMAAGYAGSDLLEGLIERWTKTASAPQIV
jgi:hypothetical protein